MIDVNHKNGVYSLQQCHNMREQYIFARKYCSKPDAPRIRPVEPGSCRVTSSYRERIANPAIYFHILPWFSSAICGNRHGQFLPLVRHKRSDRWIQIYVARGGSSRRPELRVFRVIFAFCAKPVAKNAEIRRRTPSSTYIRLLLYDVEDECHMAATADIDHRSF